MSNKVKTDRRKLHPLLTEPVDMRDGVAGMERPRNVLRQIAEDPTPLLDLAHRHMVSSRQFKRDQIVQLCRLAAAYETSSRLYTKPLAGKIMITAFYEPSTRTRLSFESAWHRLGGDVMSITDAQTTGIAKGESLQDVAEMFSNYGDVVILRDSDESSVYDMLERLRIPIINAGNGVDEHPTQALADIYALLKWRPDLFTCQAPGASRTPGADAAPTQENARGNAERAEAENDERVTIGIIGTPANMRTLRSFLILLSNFAPRFEVVVINPGNETEVFSEDQREELEDMGLRIRVVANFKAVLPELDVIYINSIAWIGDTYERLTGDLKLTDETELKPGAIILHPLARGEELDTSLDATPHNWYFAQARGAVFLRMALLTCVAQRVSRVIDAPLPYS